MAIVTLRDLENIREKHKSQKIVFCSGCFDVTHAGHVLFLEDCKKHGDVLVAMVGSDAVVTSAKGVGRPVFNEHLRIKIVDSLKPVDYTLLDYPLLDAPHPLHFIDVAIEKLKPDIYAINSDAKHIPYRKDFSKKHGARLIILDRLAPPEFDGVSTTKIIEKIKSLLD